MSKIKENKRKYDKNLKDESISNKIISRFKLLKERLSEEFQFTLENYITSIKTLKGAPDCWEKMILFGMLLLLFNSALYTLGYIFV